LSAADGITYGKLVYQYDPEKAKAEARRRIELTLADKSKTWLFLSDLSALEELPAELEQCSHVQCLSLGDDKGPDGIRYRTTKMIDQAIRYGFAHTRNELLIKERRFTDLSPLANLTSLQHLNCVSTQVADFSPLANLTSLQHLDCVNTQVADFSPLANLTSLQHLNCVSTQVADLSPLATLTSLQHLNCGNTQVADLSPLANLTSLQSLSCARTQVADLSPLANLTSLQSLSCNHTQVADLSPLVNLTSLQTLDCDDTQVADFSSLANRTSLQSLSCARTQVADLSPLANLTSLQRLYCVNTQVADLSPLANLTNLQHLNCDDTQVADFSPLATLTSFQSLSCNRTQVADLSPLANLTSLQHLNCVNTKVADLSPLANLTSLESFNCDETQVADLSPLATLTSLQSLSCGNTQVADLSPLANLTSLQRLSCSRTQVVDFSPLATLTSLQSLSCGRTQVADLSPLATLTSLQRLHCVNTQVADLSPLANLTSLQSLYCDDTQVADLSPLANLTSLQRLYCGNTQVADISPLANLTSLQHLNCVNTKVADLSPLANLTSLESFNCNSTQVADLSPLANLTSLQRLHCDGTQVADLSLLATRTSLQHLSCVNTQVADISPLATLTSLQSLDCSRLKIANMECMVGLVGAPYFEDLVAYQIRVPGIPDEVFSSNVVDNCLGRVRAHLADLGCAPATLDTVKLIVLGNGRIGKTQICNRLRNLPFEDEADSTHGIQLSDAPIPNRNGSFRIWDFGGQEIYHGTHALFLRSRAVFLVVWTPETDNNDEDIPAHGMQFRNRPVAWWLDFVQRFGEADTPLVIVQNQIDLDGAYDRGDHPDLVPMREGRSYCRALAMSAKTSMALATLKDTLAGAADSFNPPLIGPGRLSVMRKLREMLDEDQFRPTDERLHRVLSMDDFVKLCEAAGGISSPEQFLAFLHNAGEVFWSRSQKESAIILDQAWALEAIYAIYDRRKCWPKLEQSQGRFTRLLMGSFVWDREDYSVEEQKLFLSFMCQAGICFKISGHEGDDTAVYLAPDALPATTDIGHPPPLDSPDAEQTFVFEQIAPGFMRSLLVALGGEAGVHGTYWRTGFAGYEEEHRTRVRFEQILTPDNECALHLVAKGASADKVVKVLGKLTMKVVQLFGMTLKNDAPQQDEKDIQMTFAADPNAPTNFFVSYAWGDKSKPDRAKIVDDFCERAAAKGVQIRRDKDEVQFGQSISEFMEKLVDGDRIFIVLTDKYLRSVPCMTELYQIWHTSGHDREKFKSRVRLFTTPDAKIFTPVDRAKVGKFWQDKYEEEKPLLDYMADADRLAHNQLKRFYTHVPDILVLIADTLQPRNLDDLVGYALD